MSSTPKDDPMQINKTQFKPFKKYEKQHQYINNICLYCKYPSRVAQDCLKKHGQHGTHAIFTTNLQLEKSRNKHV
jgi:hypothetical protein